MTTEVKKVGYDYNKDKVNDYERKSEGPIDDPQVTTSAAVDDKNREGVERTHESLAALAKNPKKTGVTSEVDGNQIRFLYNGKVIAVYTVDEKKNIIKVEIRDEAAVRKLLKLPPVPVVTDEGVDYTGDGKDDVKFKSKVVENAAEMTKEPPTELGGDDQEGAEALFYLLMQAEAKGKVTHKIVKGVFKFYVKGSDGQDICIAEFTIVDKTVTKGKINNPVQLAKVVGKTSEQPQPEKTEAPAKSPYPNVVDATTMWMIGIDRTGNTSAKPLKTIKEIAEYLAKIDMAYAVIKDIPAGTSVDTLTTEQLNAVGFALELMDPAFAKAWDPNASDAKKEELINLYLADKYPECKGVLSKDFIDNVLLNQLGARKTKVEGELYMKVITGNPGGILAALAIIDPDFESKLDAFAKAYGLVKPDKKTDPDGYARWMTYSWVTSAENKGFRALFVAYILLGKAQTASTDAEKLSYYKLAYKALCQAYKPADISLVQVNGKTYFVVYLGNNRWAKIDLDDPSNPEYKDGAPEYNTKTGVNEGYKNVFFTKNDTVMDYTESVKK